jgi:hypothetical protein
MEDIDFKNFDDQLSDDERLLHSEVICGEADLYYIDCYLQELFRQSEEL